MRTTRARNVVRETKSVTSLNIATKCWQAIWISGAKTPWENSYTFVFKPVPEVTSVRRCDVTIIQNARSFLRAGKPYINHRDCSVLACVRKLDWEHAFGVSVWVCVRVWTFRFCGESGWIKGRHTRRFEGVLKIRLGESLISQRAVIDCLPACNSTLVQTDVLCASNWRGMKTANTSPVSDSRLTNIRKKRRFYVNKNHRWGNWWGRIIDLHLLWCNGV
jgi:hypothetical protein